eukprot:4000487-Pyramimonas_sp.AAC.1
MSKARRLSVEPRATPGTRSSTRRLRPGGSDVLLSGPDTCFSKAKSNLTWEREITASEPPPT